MPGDPSRRQILDLLRERERPVGEPVDALGISQPGVSKHLRVLRDAGFVRVRQDAQRRLYSVDPRPLARWDRFATRTVARRTGSFWWAVRARATKRIVGSVALICHALRPARPVRPKPAAIGG